MQAPDDVLEDGEWRLPEEPSKVCFYFLASFLSRSSSSIAFFFYNKRIIVGVCRKGEIYKRQGRC